MPGPRYAGAVCVTSPASVRLSIQVRLIFLYGPPAVGKYTIGSELAALTGFRLLHNHLTVNLVSAVFDRDSDVWLRLLRSFRRDILTEAARHSVDLITTGVFSGTSEHAAAWRAMVEPVEAEGGSVRFVQLTCERDELFRRVEQESRRALDKLVDAVRLGELLEASTCSHPPRLANICVWT
jgi:shikimate kinase